jgi:transposase
MVSEHPSPNSSCPGCQTRDQRIGQLQQQVADLQAQVQQLQQQIDQLQRAGNRQAAPFRRSKLKDQPKKPGRPKGHARAARRLPDHVDHVIDVPCEICPRCQVPLVDPVVHVQYQTDLPPVVPIVTQFNVHAGTCPCCQHYHQGRHPDMLSDATGACANQIGPVALTMAAELKHRLGVPYRKITDFFDTYFDLQISPGTLVRAEQRLTKKAMPTYRLLQEALQQCGIVHADETGWRIGKLNAWLWVFTCAQGTIYVIRQSRGHDVPLEILGEDFDGVLVVDGWSAYDVLACRKSRCHAHILRRCQGLLEQQLGRADARHVQDLLELLRQARTLTGQQQQLQPQAYQQRAQAWEQQLEEWVLEQTRRSGDLVQTLRMHLAEHLEEFARPVLQPQIPLDNNEAERKIRPAVVNRKVGGCNKTLLGALVHGVLSSLMVSVRQQGRLFVDLALQLWRSDQPVAIPLAEQPQEESDPSAAAGASAAEVVPKVAACASG